MFNSILSIIGNLEPEVFYLILGIVALTVIACVIIIILAVRANKRSNAKKELNRTKEKPPIKVVGNVRYANNDNPWKKDGDNKMADKTVTNNVGDVQLKRGQKYLAKSWGGDIKPGQYTLLSMATGEDKFNVRIGAYVREYSHGDTVVLADGESIISTSHSIILR